MSEMEQFQIVVSEIQATRQQMSSLNAQILELKATSDAVSNQPKELALHQQLGGVLIEVADRKSLVEVLENDIKTISEHLDRLQVRETDLMNSYDVVPTVTVTIRDTNPLDDSLDPSVSIMIKNITKKFVDLEASQSFTGSVFIQVIAIY